MGSVRDDAELLVYAQKKIGQLEDENIRLKRAKDTGWARADAAEEALASMKALYRSAEAQVQRLLPGAHAAHGVPVLVAHAPQLSASTHPLVSGLLDYAPNALAAVAAHSKYGNDKHNGVGSKLHWAFCKSTHHSDAVGTHLLQRGTVDPETGKTHTIALAWRAIMLLETELIQAGAQPGRGVDFSDCPDQNPASVDQVDRDAKKILAAFDAAPAAECWRATYAGNESANDGLYKVRFSSRAGAEAAITEYGTPDGVDWYTVEQVPCV